MVPVIWLALISTIYSRIAPFLVLNHILFPANEEAIFLWGIPWDKLTKLKAGQNNPNNTGLENPVTATDDN